MKLLLSLLASAVLASSLSAAEKQLWAKSVVGQKAPEIAVDKWLTPAPDTKGKFVLVDLWATWCGPCLRAIPELNAIQKKHADKLVVVGIPQEKEEAVAGLKNPKIEYASAIDAQGRMSKTLQVKGIPHCILIDPEGIVRWEGYPLLEGHELTEKVVADILAKGK